MTVFSILTSTTIGKIVIGIIVAAFVGVFIYDCKYSGFWRAVLKSVVAFVVIAALYLIIYYVVSKIDAPFVLVPLF